MSGQKERRVYARASKFRTDLNKAVDNWLEAKLHDCPNEALLQYEVLFKEITRLKKIRISRANHPAKPTVKPIPAAKPKRRTPRAKSK